MESRAAASSEKGTKQRSQNGVIGNVSANQLREPAKLLFFPSWLASEGALGGLFRVSDPV
jgi:hypothetical protein